MARLEVTGGSLSGTVVELDPAAPCLVGTSRRCVLRLRDPGVAFKHAEIAAGQAGAFVVTDQRSATGTFVNGERLERMVPRSLAPGDVIRFGEVEARFLAGVGSEGLEQPPPAPPAGGDVEELRRQTGRLARQLEESEEARRLREEATQDLGAKLGEVVEALMASERELETERARSADLARQLTELNEEVVSLQEDLERLAAENARLKGL